MTINKSVIYEGRDENPGLFLFVMERYRVTVTERGYAAEPEFLISPPIVLKLPKPSNRGTLALLSDTFRGIRVLTAPPKLLETAYLIILI